MMLITDLKKLRQLIWVIAVSVGYYTIKGGIFTLLKGGNHRVWGPDDSFWGENNGVALTSLMVLPLMFYLYKVHEQKWIKKGMFFAMIFTIFTVVGTQSRGALVAIGAVAAFFWFKSKSKFASGILIALTAIVLFNFLPDTWFQRMDTIATYDEDASAMGRINAWQYSINAANENLVGVGLNSWSLDTFALYAPNPTDVHAAHSIFFSVVADHGWPGALMFVLIFYFTWRKLSKLISRTGNLEYFSEINLLARMLQVSLIAYFSGGAFLSMSYFDLPWHVVSFVVLLDDFLEKNELLKTA
jgi:probable O-glycosylation ligase (exosortase A-associated)